MTVTKFVERALQRAVIECNDSFAGLAAEAVAAAAYLATVIEVEIDTPQLRAAAHAVRVEYRSI